MNFKNEHEAKRFLAIWALIIIGICLIVILLTPVAQASQPPRNKWAISHQHKGKKEKLVRRYDRMHNRSAYKK
jgi:hypothetical protein